MSRISFSKEGSTSFQKLLGHNKDILEHWNRLEESLFKSSTFSDELKEEIRRILAFNNGCMYCMAKGSPSDSLTNTKELLSLKLADYFSKNIEITDEFFDLLKLEYSDKEISELCAFICFITACQKYGALLNLLPSCEIN